ALGADLGGTGHGLLPARPRRGRLGGRLRLERPLYAPALEDPHRGARGREPLERDAARRLDIGRPRGPGCLLEEALGALPAELAERRDRVQPRSLRALPAEEAVAPDGLLDELVALVGMEAG